MKPQKKPIDQKYIYAGKMYALPAEKQEIDEYLRKRDIQKSEFLRDLALEAVRNDR